MILLINTGNATKQYRKRRIPLLKAKRKVAQYMDWFGPRYVRDGEGTYCYNRFESVIHKKALRRLV